jgi:hypothetical protein
MNICQICDTTEVGDSEVCINCFLEAANESKVDTLEPRCTKCTTGVLQTTEEINSEICDTCYFQDKREKNPAWPRGAGIYPWVKSSKFNQGKAIYVSCTHDGMPKVFDIGQGTVYASGIRDVSKWDHTKYDLLIGLLGPVPPIVSLNNTAKELISKELYSSLYPTESAPHLTIKWSDGQEPPVNVAFIGDLVRLVSSGVNVLIHCHGGHGRTGTLLTAMAIEAKLVPKKLDPIKWVRTQYCLKSVETSSQVDWLTETYGFKTEENGSNKPTGYEPYTITKTAKEKSKS